MKIDREEGWLPSTEVSDRLFKSIKLGFWGFLLIEFGV